jgi:hypothetical protein
MNKADFNQKLSCPDFMKGTEVGLEMPKPKKESFWRRFATLMDIGLLKDPFWAFNFLRGRDEFQDGDTLLPCKSRLLESRHRLLFEHFCSHRHHGTYHRSTHLRSNKSLKTTRFHVINFLCRPHTIK